MAKLRIVSWNLRTFGDPAPPEVALQSIADIIVYQLQADIVCIQEVQSGSEAEPTIGADISPDIDESLAALCDALETREPEGGWVYTVSGLNNSEKSGTMRDAYAFFWKERPSASPRSHAAAPLMITCIQGTTILRQSGKDLFPGRRPGLIIMEVVAAANTAPVQFNLLSWHAATPCNTVGKAGKGPTSGRALMALATLKDIGGVERKDRSGGWGTNYQWVAANPLPSIDTIFLGDCNFTASANKSDIVYHNLNTNYLPCIPDDTITTYSADPTKPLQGTSSYDKIFVLRQHAGFRPGLSFEGTWGCFDFIAFQARQLGAAAEISYFPTETAWYVCYLDAYKKQHAKPGISDHLPVWADFTIGTASAQASKVKPTSGAANNCLFHAVYGTPDINGTYVDAAAAQHRTDFANLLEQAITAPNFATVRHNVLSAMIEEFQHQPSWRNAAQLLLTNGSINPFGANIWAQMVAAYLTGIRSGRMLYVHEAEILAQQMTATFRLWFVAEGDYRNIVLNDGQIDERDIYHFGLHFFHYDSA